MYESNTSKIISKFRKFENFAKMTENIPENKTRQKNSKIIRYNRNENDNHGAGGGGEKKNKIKILKKNYIYKK
jgi:hypothetical protein